MCDARLKPKHCSELPHHVARICPVPSREHVVQVWLLNGCGNRGWEVKLVDAYHVEPAINRASRASSASRPNAPRLQLGARAEQSKQARSGERLQKAKPGTASLKLPSTSTQGTVEIFCIRNCIRCSNPVDIIPLSQSIGLGHQTHLLNPLACASIHLLTCSIHAE